jgi:hypothetical protein
MNWGKSLILAFVLFAGFIFYLAYSCMNTHFDLVSKDYYKEELEYQNVINSKQNAAQLSKEISLKNDNKKITLSLPEELKAKEVKGTIHFYAIQDAQRDQNLNLSFDQNGEQIIDANKFYPGSYKAKIQYSCAGKDYYSEMPLNL